MGGGLTDDGAVGFWFQREKEMTGGCFGGEENSSRGVLCVSATLRKIGLGLGFCIFFLMLSK